MRKEIVTSIAAAIVAGAALFYAADYAVERDCKNRWQDSGLGFRYETFGGCQIEHSPARWIPAENYIVKGN